MKIAVAMSGGVDSSMAALLLREQGHDIIGITAVMFADGNDLSSIQSVRDARSVSQRFGFPLEVADLRKEFSRSVVMPFCGEYLKGRTPNPCIECNALIKFSLLFDIARLHGCDKIATGHYVILKESPGGRLYLSRNPDPSKDQSYFLYRLTQEQLRRSLFPLGSHTKAQIVAMANDRKLELADKAESQEICFIPDNDYPRFIEIREAVKAPGPGEIIDSEGNVIGRHGGIHRYTIGQRRGLGISSEQPLYVTGIDYEKNIIIAGKKEELAVNAVSIRDVTHMKRDGFDGIESLVKTRSTQKPVRARLAERGNRVTAAFDEPQYGISPGQSAVFYDSNGDVLGGGYIDRPV